MYIFKAMGLHCVSFLLQVIPGFLNIMCQSNSVGMLEFYFQQLGILVSIVKQHIRNYLAEIFTLVEEYWNPASNTQGTIISLVEAIAGALDGEFKIYLPRLLPHLLQI